MGAPYRRVPQVRSIPQRQGVIAPSSAPDTRIHEMDLSTFGSIGHFGRKTVRRRLCITQRKTRSKDRVPRIFTIPKGLVQLGFDLGDRPVDQAVALRGGHLLGDQLAGHGDGNAHRLVAHILDRSSLRIGDLLFGGGHPALQ